MENQQPRYQLQKSYKAEAAMGILVFFFTLGQLCNKTKRKQALTLTTADGCRWLAGEGV